MAREEQLLMEERGQRCQIQCGVKAKFPLFAMD